MIAFEGVSREIMGKSELDPSHPVGVSREIMGKSELDPSHPVDARQNHCATKPCDELPLTAKRVCAI